MESPFDKSSPSSPSDALVATCLQRMESEGESALDAICEEHPEHASRIRAQVEALRHLGLMSKSGEADEGPADEDADLHGIPRTLGDYRLVRRLGHGGMGIVYLAEQTSLDRRVALKLIRPEQLYFGHARLRFRREVEAVARLSHPNIVPIFTVGEENGIPFYAMEHVLGASLDRLVKAVCDQRPEHLTGSDFREVLARSIATDERSAHAAWNEAFFRGSWANVVLRIVRRVADALEHAHGRGVLHRDVKLANIMVTPDGRVLLLDFGLAALRGESDLTRTGTQLGSLPYMPPEHVAGSKATFSPASDVYSTGITLYTLLGLRLPFQDEHPEQVRQQILEGMPMALRRRNRSLSLDAETVCRTAMDPDPARRYASAGDFARDLQHLVDGEPVTARPAGPVLRFTRWTRRHPALAVLLLAAIALPTAISIQRNHAAGELALALTGETSERERAEDHLDLALQAIQSVLEPLGDEALRDVPDAQRVRWLAVEEGLRLVSNLEQQRPQDRRVQQAVADLRLRRGDLHLDADRVDLAMQDYDAAEIVYRARQQAEPTTSDTVGLAAILHQRSIACIRAGDLDAADQVLAEALPLLSAVRTANQGNPLEVLAMATRLGVLRRIGQWDEGLRLCEDALALAQDLAASRPQDLEVRRALALVHLNRGNLLEEAGITDQRLSTRQTCADLYRALYRDHPDWRSSRQELALALLNLSKEQEQAGQIPAAFRSLSESEELLRALHSDYPDAAEYRGHLAEAVNNQGTLRANQGGHADALRLFEEALDLLELDASVSLPSPEWQEVAALAVANQAHALLYTEQFEDAMERAELAFDLLEPLLEADPTRDGYCFTYTLAAVSHARSGFAIGCYEEAEMVLEVAEQFGTSHPWHARLLADAWNEGILALRASADMDPDLREIREDRAITEMFRLLKVAVELGYEDAAELTRTPALASFQADPRLQRILAAVKRR